MRRVLRLTVVILLVALATGAGWYYWNDQHLHPHTRDAYVRGNVVGIAAQVEGPITRLGVVDNQLVHSGELLFEIDPQPFEARVRTVEGKLGRAEAAGALGPEEVQPYTPLVAGPVVP